MKNLLGTSLIAVLLMGGASIAHGQVSFGVRIGPPPAVRVEHAPPRPGPDYVWVKGYWYPGPGGHYVWHDGYWTRPPYDGAHWVAPHRSDGQFYEGYWDGSHGRVDHNHDWDRDQNRDYERWHDDHH